MAELDAIKVYTKGHTFRHESKKFYGLNVYTFNNKHIAIGTKEQSEIACEYAVADFQRLWGSNFVQMCEVLLRQNDDSINVSTEFMKCSYKMFEDVAKLNNGMDFYLGKSEIVTISSGHPEPKETYYVFTFDV